jgi:subtilisin-like proprotein convertase family protein
MRRTCWMAVSALALATNALASVGGAPTEVRSDPASPRPAGTLAAVRLELTAPDAGRLLMAPGKLEAATDDRIEATEIRRGEGDFRLWIRYDARADRLDATVSSDLGDFSTAASSLVARGMGSVDPLRFEPLVQGLFVEVANRGTEGAIELRDLEISTSGGQQRLHGVGAGRLGAAQLLQVNRRLADGFELVGTLHLTSVRPTADHPLILELDLTAQSSEPVRRPDANGGTFTNGDGIAIPGTGTVGDSNPYPSVIDVFGLSGVVTHVSAAFNGLSHTFPDDIDALLVAPDGSTVMLMSDACGSTDLVGANYTFDSGAAGPMADAGPCPDGSYQPSDYVTGDPMPSPAPPGPYGNSLSALNGINPNGTWSLFVEDDANGDTGSMTTWSVTLTTQILINDAAPASPYPSTYTLSGFPATLSLAECTLSLFSVNHTFPGDIDMLWEVPSGQNAVIMSDSCGGGDLVNVNLDFFDSAGTFLPDNSCVSGSYRPTNFGAGDPFPPPAPAGTNGRSLGDVEGSSPNGAFNLYVVDDLGGNAGTIDDWGFGCSAVDNLVFRDSFETGDTLRWSSESP